MKAVVKVDPSQAIGYLDPMVFGQYLEHVQPDDSCIYGAVMDEGSALAGPGGLRNDVIAACTDLQVPVVRWPGGCFADVYNWEDGVGPRTQRPVRVNWQWGGLENNHFGTDEFLTWCEQIGSTPYINVNLGTGTLDSALRWLDYCNGTAPSTDVLRRQASGRHHPYRVPLWGIGNEQWGVWEAGHMDAPEYARRLRNWAQFFRKADPDVRLLGVGSHNAADPEWDLTVLRIAGEFIDYLTIHSYSHALIGDTSPAEYYATVGGAVLFEERLRRACATVAAAMPSLRRETPICIALDEWNIRHLVRDEHGRLELRRRSPRTYADALFAAGVFNAMMRLAPHVGMACYVFLVNGNGVLLTNADGLVCTPLYDVFRIYRRCMLGRVVQTRVESPTAAHALRAGGDASRQALRVLGYVDAVATVDDERATLNVAILNRHLVDTLQVRLLAGGNENARLLGAWELYHDDVWAVNDHGSPNHIRMQERCFPQGPSEFDLKPHSLVVLQFGTR